MATTKKVEAGTIYMAGLNGKVIEVRPANGKVFDLSELQAAVGGYVESMIPAVKRTRVYVDEEGWLKNTRYNIHTWTFADRRVYVELNGYDPRWLVPGTAIVVRKIETQDPKAVTVAEALRTSYDIHTTTA